MKGIIKFKKSTLEKLLHAVKEEDGFMGNDPNFKGASYNKVESKPDNRIQVLLNKDEISFLEDVLENIVPDNQR